MDILKLFEKVMQSEELQGIPEIYVRIVFNAIIDAINSGECFYSLE